MGQSQSLHRFPFAPRKSLAVSGALAIALVLMILSFLHAGTWLVREDPLETAQAVVVLSGGLPERALSAADVFRRSHATEVWLTRPRQPGASMAELNLPFSGEEQYNRMVLISRGVPPESIRVLPGQIDSTADELRGVFEELSTHPGFTAVILTSGIHTRRVRAIWRVVAHGNKHGILVRASQQRSFDPRQWWRTSDGALAVVREYLGLLNAWAGLPLRHSS